MTLRIHFTAEDLARTRIAEAPRPLLELSTAIRLLQERRYPVRFDAWRRAAIGALRPETRRLFALIPSVGWSADFLTPAEPGDADTLFDRVRATPEAQVHDSLAEWAEHRETVPSWARSLTTDRRLRQELIDTLEETNRRLVAPYWPQIASLAGADRALRIRHLAEGGMELALSLLNPPLIRWRPPVLELTMASGIDGDLCLDGHGLLLIPSLFGTRFPAVNDTARPQPWVTYPIRADDHALLPPTATAAALSAAPSSLSALLGRTRATVLWVIADHPGSTTTELAERAGISLASASEHATVLRSANLISTTRHRNTALHTATAAGLTLLSSASAGPAGAAGPVLAGPAGAAGAAGPARPARPAGPAESPPPSVRSK
ncbi:helix-turn-helix domain-containing protein [Streptomyces sp. HNM0663]|uniref:Helix-turn-helix domain-containing protein n=1 Tax=Streptomyces chengmaiensis TaxID=3040919 RepID=A0ABT6HTY3_9ACTN|nr:helix-turn-helix domain-containing protein [Streptomyces chengmaiensis]MDH2392183.1 helix-turn-helix domain-containing protein [Streptomyces chengmaiensis]